ncbi:MAG: SDR family oxidoreductase [bacterium]
MSSLSSRSRYQIVRDELVAHPQTWLVTGAAGFIGSNLAQELVGLGQHVVGFDNFSTGYQHNVDEVTAACVGSTGTFRFVEGDIRDVEACRAACVGVNFVLHQAALASVPRSIADPISSTAVNVDGFLNVLVAARDASAKRVVYASSSSVYGDATTIPQVEDKTGTVLSPYAATKATNELFAGVFQRTYGLQTVGLRYFNVFGRRQDPNGAYAAVIPRWIDALLKESPCRIFGDGETSRDFCYIANVVQANILAAVADDDATSQAYNVACGEETSLNELFTMIRDGLVAQAPFVAAASQVYDEARPGDIRRSLADIGKARKLLGYEPTHRAAAGLEEALQWYATQLLSLDSETAAAL